MVPIYPHLAKMRTMADLKRLMRRWIIIISLALCPALSHAAETNAIVSAWLKAQANIHTWTADFTQTRSLKSLAQPLTATGHVWFAAPSQFRWEIGSPPQTIVVRGADNMLVIYPRLKHAERYPLTGNEAGPWRDMIKLLEAGFPHSEAEMQSQYNILNEKVTDDVCELTLQPKSATARKMMPQIKIGFSTTDSSLRSTELQFADGSTMRNDFKNAQLNPQVDNALFSPKLESYYKVSEPFKQ